MALVEEKIQTIREERKKEVYEKIKHKPVEDMQLNKQDELDFVYTTFDKIFRLSLGEMPIFSGAFYHGDFSLTLEQAQLNKCKFICEQLGIKEGTRVLDLGCGWGGWLNYLRSVGAKGVGLNLSSGQVASCRKNGLEVYLKDIRYVTPDDHGTFDTLTAMGSPEHVCTLDDYKAGKQDQVYNEWFSRLHKLVTVGAKIYMQTMTFGRYAVPLEKFDIKAPKESPAYILALLRKQFPNSWLPYGGEHLIRCAEPYFKCTFHDSGRTDYVQTDREWTKLYKKFGVRKYLLFLSLLPKYLRDKEFRWNFNQLMEHPNRKAFEREIFDHSRIVFQKQPINE